MSEQVTPAAAVAGSRKAGRPAVVRIVSLALFTVIVAVILVVAFQP